MNQHATNAATANFIAQFRLVWIVAVILLASSVACGQDLPVRGEVPDGTGQLESVPALFSGGVDEQGRDYLLNGQLATNGKLILTASNGFFDNGVCPPTKWKQLLKSSAMRRIAKQQWRGLQNASKSSNQP